MKIIEESIWENRTLKATWHNAPFLPPRELITQASGICFDKNFKIIVVSKDNINWQLVGGHPEKNETIEEAFMREAAEEACAKVTKLIYLGSQEVNDPQNPEGLVKYYQTRFYARVNLMPFHQQYEIIARKCVSPQDLGTTLKWQTNKILEQILHSALNHHQKT